MTSVLEREGNTTHKRQTVKTLSTGHQIYLTNQEERMLKRVYDYLAGHAMRQQHILRIESKRQEVAKISTEISQLPKESEGASDGKLSSLKSYREDQRSLVEKQTDTMFQAKDELEDMEEKYQQFELQKHKIGFKDIDMVLRNLGAAMHKRNIEFMIWEVDEESDNAISWDEFQLTYYRNITDTAGTEPCTFFHVLEFLTFDENNKGYIIEDDCMEILFARHGSSRLEKELSFLFGSQLRAAGGNGTLNLSEYLAATMGRTGRRAVVP